MRRLLPLAAAAVLAGCGGATIAPDDVEARILSRPALSDGSPFESADCGDEPLPAEVGATTTCTAESGTTTYDVLVEVTDVDGGQASYDLTASRRLDP